MAVISVTRMWSKQTSNITTSDRKTYNATFSEGYQIVCDPLTSDDEIRSHPSLPKVGQIFPGFFSVYCNSVSLNQDSPILVTASVSYSGQVGPKSKTPLDQPPEISWTDTASDEEIDQDFDGNAIVTVNGEPIFGVTTQIIDDVVNIKRNFLTFDPYVRRAYRRSVNSDTFLGWPPGTAKFTKLDAQYVAAADDVPAYFIVTASIQFREPYQTTADKAWYARVRHEGFRVKQGSQIVHAKDDFQKEVTQPVLLKLDGTQETNPANATWLEFKRYGALPYNSLGLLQ